MLTECVRLCHAEPHPRWNDFSWIVGVLTVTTDPMHCLRAGEVEFRSLNPTELAVCTEAARPGGLRLRDTDDAALMDSLHRRGLLYLEVPIRPDDHVSIPPLEVGFWLLPPSLFQLLSSRLSTRRGRRCALAPCMLACSHVSFAS